MLDLGEKGLHIAAEVGPQALGTGLSVVAPVGLAAQCVVSGIALRSAYKSHMVWSDLQKMLFDIYSHKVQVTCTPLTELGKFREQAHRMVLFHVLPYVCRKKRRKEERQTFKATPVAGVFSGLYSVGKKIQKKIQGTSGVHREQCARWLAYHFMTCDCMVAQQFVSILFAGADTEPFEHLEYDELTERLAEKMKSI